MKRILMLLFAVMALLQMYGQNAIDKRVDMYSTMGASTFTSVVERDPATHKVNKVVKVLKMSSFNASGFAEVFKAESHTGTFTSVIKDNKVTMVLTVERKDCARVYVLTYDKRQTSAMDASVTIIVNYRK